MIRERLELFRRTILIHPAVMADIGKTSAVQVSEEDDDKKIVSVAAVEKDGPESPVANDADDVEYVKGHPVIRTGMNLWISQKIDHC